MRKIVHENQIGLLFSKGRLINCLRAGSYSELFGRKIEILEADKAIRSVMCPLETLLTNENFKKMTVLSDVADGKLVLHYKDGRFFEILEPGKYAFLKDIAKHEFIETDASVPTVAPNVPQFIFSKIPLSLFEKYEVGQYCKGLLYFDNKFEKVLESGTYYFWKTNVRVDVREVDMRLTQLEVSGQEMLTSDKVTLRINFVCNYKITDCVKIISEVDDYSRQLYVAAQLALRDYVGRQTLDELLSSKDKLIEYVAQRLKERQESLYLEISDADVKDIILPGEIRDIVNTVLIAEKRAQANVITRREEVASTRSLLNTARLMEENKTLYKLKELEYVEKICEHVGNINLCGSGSSLLESLIQLAGNDKTDKGN